MYKGVAEKIGTDLIRAILEEKRRDEERKRIIL